MRRMNQWILAAMLCSVLTACQDRSASTEPPKNQTAPPLIDPQASTPVQPIEPKKTPAPEEPDTPPVAAVRTVLQGVEAGRLEVLADFLPESCQKDVAALVQAFAGKMPDDLWTQFHRLAEKGAAVLKKQPLGSEPAEVAAANDAEFHAKLASALDTLTDNTAWDRAAWEKFKLREFLQGPGSAVFVAWQNLSPANSSVLSETKVQLRNLDGDHATLVFQSTLEPEPRPVEFVHVEGKWIPKSLADGWQDTVRKGLADLQRLEPDRIAELSDRIRPKLLQIERTLDQMLKAEKPEQVQLGWWQIQSLLVQSRQEWAGTGPPPSVEIRINGELTDDELTVLLDQLVQAADQPDAAEYVTIPTTTGTVIQLSPVKDFEAFTRRLTFVTLKGQDAENRSVNVERGTKNEE